MIENCPKDPFPNKILPQKNLLCRLFAQKSISGRVVFLAKFLKSDAEII